MVSVACQTVHQIDVMRLVELREDPAPSEERQRKLAVRLLIGILFSQTLDKADVFVSLSKQRIAVNLLFDKIWAEVQNTEFEVSSRTFQYFSESVSQELVKMLGNDFTVLYHMFSQDPVYSGIIVRCFTENLLRPKHHRFMHRFKQYFRDNGCWLRETTALLAFTGVVGLAVVVLARSINCNTSSFDSVISSDFYKEVI